MRAYPRPAFGQELSDRYEVEVLDISDRGPLGECAPSVAAERRVGSWACWA